VLTQLFMIIQKHSTGIGVMTSTCVEILRNLRPPLPVVSIIVGEREQKETSFSVVKELISTQPSQDARVKVKNYVTTLGSEMMTAVIHRKEAVISGVSCNV
jgi:hypothetical protein